MEQQHVQYGCPCDYDECAYDEDDVYAALQPFARHSGARVACGAEKQLGGHAQIEHAAADGEKGFVGKQGCEHGEDASAHRHALAVEIHECQSAAAYCGWGYGGGELAEHVDAEALREREFALAEIAEAQCVHKVLDGEEEYGDARPGEELRG